MSENKATIKPGIYQHYKGNEYRVYEIAQHTETDEIVVVYRYLYGDFGLSVRPLEMFNDTVEVDTANGKKQLPRFAFVREADDGGLE